MFLRIGSDPVHYIEAIIHRDNGKYFCNSGVICHVYYLHLLLDVLHSKIVGYFATLTFITGYN